MDDPNEGGDESRVVETVIYEQCPYDWDHVRQIYRKILVEPAIDSIWYVQESKQGEDVRYRRIGKYFQFLSGDPGQSLFQEFLAFAPMETADDAEWTVEKHDDDAFLVRSVWTQTFGPVDAMSLVDAMLEPYDLWLENKETWCSGAALFRRFDSDSMLDACNRLVALERWCIEANEIVTDTLTSYWGTIHEKISHLIDEGMMPPERIVDASSAKRREPLNPSIVRMQEQ